MSTNAQAAANRQNSQASTGPTTPEGKKKSSLNATTHGFTGQKLFLTDEEKPLYEIHCLSFVEHYSPANLPETELLQQYADLTWSLHQISVQELNTMAIINALTAELLAAGDLSAIAPALAPHYRTLNNLSLYEQRRRRAADAVLARFIDLAQARRQQLSEAAKLYAVCKSRNQPFIPSEFGFVHSMTEIEKFLHQSTRLVEAKKLLNP
jgi:hypothetical protein